MNNKKKRKKEIVAFLFYFLWDFFYSFMCIKDDQQKFSHPLRQHKKISKNYLLKKENDVKKTTLLKYLHMHSMVYDFGYKKRQVIGESQ
jgi:hypothetical protein